ncbi:MAG: hypothetical protein FJW30_16230 [Acidobacteria bacterium]|nr:hypothetical protein [Acidobacteriota bacterium]
MDIDADEHPGDSHARLKTEMWDDTSMFPWILATSLLTQPEVRPNPNKAVPLAAVVTFRAGGPVTTEVVISDGKNQWKQRFTSDPAKGLPIVGMRAARKHTISLTVRDPAGRRVAAPEPLEFTTPPLPAGAGEMPPFRITVNDRSRKEPGFTMFSPRRARQGQPRFGAGYGMLLAIDDDGEVVWYFRTDSRISDLQRLRSGNIAFVTQDYRITEIDVLGNTVREYYASKRPEGAHPTAVPVETTTFHHEVDELPNGNLIALGSEVRELDNYFTSETDAGAPRKRQKVMGDEVVEFDRAGKVVWRWNAFDVLDPYRIGFETFSGYWDRRGFPGVVDWSHANGMMYDEKDDAILICFRYLAIVVKVDRNSKQVRWIAGDPKGHPSALQGKFLKMAGGAQWFYHQHAPMPTPRGTLLLFDNGNYRAVPFDKPMKLSDTWSRAAEYAIDEKSMTIRETWSSEPKTAESVVGTAMGDVDWMPKTGNVLVHYGALLPQSKLSRIDWDTMQQAATWTRIREYTHTRRPKLVWEVVIGDPEGKEAVTWVLFGGDRVPALLPGMTVR